MRHPPAPSSRRAFTLTELLVVISIIVLLIALAVPAFNNITTNSERTLADNQLRVGLSAGRDAAIRSDGGDGAAVFLFTPGGRVTIVPCVQVGLPFEDKVVVGQASGAARKRDVFVPVPQVEPVVLPRGWSVRAYASPGTITVAPGGTGDVSGWYENFATRAGLSNNWVFPESGFLQAQSANDSGVSAKGWQRQSFLVRFTAGTGELDTTGREALVIDPLPVPDEVYRTTSPWAPGLARQLALDPARFARMVMKFDSGTMNSAEKQQVLGDMSADTVLCRGVTELAMYREEALASALGVSLNRRTGTIYAPDTDATTGPKFDDAVVTALGDADAVMDAIGEWMIGRWEVNGKKVESDVKLYTLQRYLGQVREIVPGGAQENSP